MTIRTRRAAAAAGLVLASVSYLAACSDAPANSEAHSAKGPASTTDSTDSLGTKSSAADVLPEGVYRTPPLTADDIRAAANAGGFTRTEAAAVTDLFSDSVVWELTLADGRWTQSEIYDGAPADVGWEGSYTVTDGHTVVATEDGGSAITYGYELFRNKLTLTPKLGSAWNRDDALHQTVIYESAPFIRRAASNSGASQSVDDFVVPFTIELADWLDPEPSQKSSTFVTWEAPDHSRGLRVMSPVAVYLPGHRTTSPPPADFAAYLTSLRDAGAEVDDIVRTEVDGLPATEMTIGLASGTQSAALDGAIGCPALGQSADVCFGPQEDLLLRLVAVDVAENPVLIWERDPRSAAVGLTDGSFDAMIETIQFH